MGDLEPFHDLCDALEACSAAVSERARLEHLLSKNTNEKLLEQGNWLYNWIRLVLPDQDREKPFGIRIPRLGAFYLEALNIVKGCKEYSKVKRFVVCLFLFFSTLDCCGVRFAAPHH